MKLHDEVIRRKTMMTQNAWAGDIDNNHAIDNINARNLVFKAEAGCSQRPSHLSTAPGTFTNIKY